MRLRGWLAGVVLGICLPAVGATAQEAPLTLPAPSGQPVVLTADQISYDEALDLVVASGNVEISQDARILRADRVIYSRRTDVVTATGNVVLVESDGSVVFAGYAELQGDLASGFVQQVGMLLTDNSRLAANSGVRSDARITQLERVVYSPCDLCASNPRQAPLWQLRAVSATHDNETQDVVYRDAFLDMFGLPLLYTPYLSHPDPRVERRSGFLPPLFGSTPTLGLFVVPTYYWAIAPEQDATFRLGVTQHSGAFGRAEYRRRFENAALSLDGSLNRSDLVHDSGLATERTEAAWRGHLFADGRYDIDEHWRAVGQLRLTSDPTYLDVFRITGDDTLTSRGVVEGFYGLSYLSAESIGFRDLRQGALAQPLVLPLLTASYVGEPGEMIGGQLFANASVLNLERPEDPSLGATTRRISLGGGWQRQDYTDFGLVTHLVGSLRGDFYYANDFQDPDTPSLIRDNVVAARMVPQFEATASYPLVRHSEDLQGLVEPILAFTAVGDFGRSRDIPNNDSRSIELDEVNLFSANRYSGYDRVEDGVRVTYGVRLGAFAAGGGSGTLFVGQSYRLAGDNELPAGSGLENRTSDVVGRLNLSPLHYLNLDWRFQLDDRTLEARRHEVTASVGVPQLTVSTTYTFAQESADATVVGGREEIVVGASSRLSQYWSANGYWTHDLAEGVDRNVSIGFSYQDECFTLGLQLLRDLTVNRDRDEGNSVYVTIGFRNLGQPVTIGGGGSSSSNSSSLF